MTSFKIPPPQLGLDLVDGLVRRPHWRVLRVSSVLSPHHPHPRARGIGRRARLGSGDLHVFVLPLSFILPPTRETRQRQTKSREGGREGGMGEERHACGRTKRRRRTDDDFLCLIMSPMKREAAMLRRALRHSARSNVSRGLEYSISCSASVQSLRQRRMKEAKTKIRITHHAKGELSWVGGCL